MAASAKTTTFAEQRAFAAKVAKEKAALERAVQQSTEEQQEQEQPRRRVRQRRTTRDGQEIFAVTFFDGSKPKRTDWHAEDARRNAEFGVTNPAKGSLEYRLRQLKSKGLSKSRSEPCLGTKTRGERKKSREDDSTKLNPFRTLFPLPAKGIDMRKETARDEADLFKPRPETVALSATEKHEMRMWGIDVDAVAWPDGTKPRPWVKAVGNTTNKWANKELGIRAAREKQEFVDKLREASPSRNKRQPPSARPAPDSSPSASKPFYSSFSSTKTAPPPPWVKELPPVRDGRRQFASGEIIPFLDQHTYPEGGVAEAKRARRREKEAFLKALFTPNMDAPPPLAAQRKNAPNAAADTAGAAKRRPPRVRRVDNESGFCRDGVCAGEDAVKSDPPGRAWPYGPVCTVVPTRKREHGNRSGDSGGDCSTEEILRTAAGCDAAAGGGGGGGAAVYDAVRPVSLEEGGIVALGTDAGTKAGNEENPAGGAAGGRSNSRAGEQSDHDPDGRRHVRPALGHDNESGPGLTERVPRAATPSPVVTSSVRVLDMGVVRPSE